MFLRSGVNCSEGFLQMARKFILPLVATLVAPIFIPIITTGAGGALMGIALQATESLINRDTAVDGTNIYAEDWLETGEKGAMSVELDDSRVFLSSDTTIKVHRIEDGFSVDLTRGAAVISTAEGRGFEALIDGATIRPVGKHATSAEIMWIGPQEFLLSGKHGDLEIILGGESKTVGAGSSYRVSVDPNDPSRKDNLAPGAEPGGGKSSGASPSGSNRLSVVTMSAASIGATFGVVRVLVSPSQL